MKIQKGRAVKLFVALGLKNADKWNDERLAAKLGKVNEMVDEDVTLEEAEAATLAEVRATVAAGEEFEIDTGEQEVAAEPAADKPTDKPAKKKGLSEAEKAAVRAAKDQEAADKKAAKEAEKAAAIAAREATAGVYGRYPVLPREQKPAVTTNWYLVGKVLGEFGNPTTITPAMFDRLNELRGTVNCDSVGYLMQAWNVLAGFNAAVAAKSVG